MSITPFAMKASAFRIAKAAFTRFSKDFAPNNEAPDHEQRAYEAAYLPLVSAMTDTGLAVVKCPAASIHELAEKIEIFRSEEMYEYQDVADLLDLVIDDARRLEAVAS
ncbi:hypothetical protein ATE67_10140 [Sphingopyxis sp. H050]|jgi:hypothetical protein|uniref:hypothetical protein n=1 Tax=Sphingopyxis sp. H050 TaxID=1759072 RepID=UPI000736A396|nr:hypothetical protein [Sphingopyxis sp. H050]KTE20596.1 hypothetical protein ATE67_10140 [Sphingopyxis sp. H050]